MFLLKCLNFNCRKHYLMDSIFLLFSPSFTLLLSQRHNFIMQIHIWFQKNLSLDLNSTLRSQITQGKKNLFFFTTVCSWSVKIILQPTQLLAASCIFLTDSHQMSACLYIATCIYKSPNRNEVNYVCLLGTTVTTSKRL